MFANKLALLALLAATVISAATTGGKPSEPLATGVWSQSKEQCTTGSLNCCKSVQNVQSPATQKLLGVIDGTLDRVTGQAGVDCSPITGIGASGTSCNAAPACCKDNNFNGLIVPGCTTINGNA